MAEAAVAHSLVHYMVEEHSLAELLQYRDWMGLDVEQNPVEHSQTAVDTQAEQEKAERKHLVHWVTVGSVHRLADQLEVSEPEGVHNQVHIQTGLTVEFHSQFGKWGELHNLVEKDNLPDLDSADRHYNLAGLLPKAGRAEVLGQSPLELHRRECGFLVLG